MASSSASDQVTWQTAMDYFLLFSTEFLQRLAKLYYIGKDKSIYAEIQGDRTLMAEYMGDNVWGTGLDAAFKACSPEIRRTMLELLDIERSMNSVALLRDAAIEYGIDTLLQTQSIPTRVHFYQALGLSITKDGRVGMHAAILKLGLVPFFSMRSFTLKILEELLTTLQLPIPQGGKKGAFIASLVNYQPPRNENHGTERFTHLRRYMPSAEGEPDRSHLEKTVQTLVDGENRIRFDDDDDDDIMDTEAVQAEHIEESFQPEIVIDMDDGLEDMTLFESTDVTEREIWREFFMERYTGTVNVPLVAIFKEMKAFMREHRTLMWDHLLDNGAEFHTWFGREIKPLLFEMKMQRGDSPTVGMLCTFPQKSSDEYYYYFCCPQCRKGFHHQHILVRHLETHRQRGIL
jgi:hypothetical protein